MSESQLPPIEATGDPDAERYAAEMRARAILGLPFADETGENNNDKETTDE